MKKFVVLILVFLYLLPAIGFSINVHWCGNLAQRVEFGFVQNKKCSCGAKMLKGCCKNIQTIIKLTDTQHTASTIISPTNFIDQCLPVPFFYEKTIFAKEMLWSFADDSSPPGKNKLPVYLTNRNFRI